MTDERILFFSGHGPVLPGAGNPGAGSPRPKDRGLALTGLLAGYDAKEKLVAAFPLPDDGYTGDSDLRHPERSGQAQRDERVRGAKSPLRGA